MEWIIGIAIAIGLFLLWGWHENQKKLAAEANPGVVVRVETSGRRSSAPARKGTLPPPEPLPDPLLDLRGVARGFVHVVGESFYQPALTKVSGGRTEGGPARREQDAVIAREPTNAHDPNAVRVCLTSGDGMYHVGHLGREDAKTYQQVLKVIEPHALLVRAELTGGWQYEDDDDEGGSIGVVLELPPPGVVAVHAWLELHPTPKEDHDLVGTRVYFAGDSTTRILGQALDKDTRQLLATHAGCPPGAMAKATSLVITGRRPHLDKGWPRVKEYGTPTITEAEFWTRVGLAPNPLAVQ